MSRAMGGAYGKKEVMHISQILLSNPETKADIRSLA